MGLTTHPPEGVSVQICAALCLVTFLLAYLFFWLRCYLWLVQKPHSLKRFHLFASQWGVTCGIFGFCSDGDFSIVFACILFFSLFFSHIVVLYKIDKRPPTLYMHLRLVCGTKLSISQSPWRESFSLLSFDFIFFCTFRHILLFKRWTLWYLFFQNGIFNMMVSFFPWGWYCLILPQREGRKEGGINKLENITIHI